jgi:hypothetical protein
MSHKQRVVILLLNEEHLQECYEILCDLPFETATMNDIEPPTQRQPGIEQLIAQINGYLQAARELEEK